MTEEIKEILDDVKRHLDYVETTKQSSIRDNEMKAMYNYITNLQKDNEELQTTVNDCKQENKTLKNLISQHIDESDNLIDYKSRNEKAIEKLTIKQARLINEKDYKITDLDLDEIMKVLEEGK